MQTSQDISSDELSPFRTHDDPNHQKSSRGLFVRVCGWLFGLVVAITLVPAAQMAIEWRLIEDAFWVVIPLFLLTCILAVVRGQREALTGSEGRSFLVLGLFCTAMPLLIFAYLIMSAWLTLFVLLMLATALTIRLSGKTSSTAYLAALMLMLLFVWVPFGIGLGIQRVIKDSVLSGVFAIFNIQGWSFRNEGEFLAFMDFRLDLKPLMEGYISLVSILYLVGLLVFIRRRPMIHSFLLMLCGVAIVWLVLALRVFVVSFLAMRWNIVEWTGILRWMLELGSFVITAFLAYGLDQSLAGILGKIRLDGEYARLRSERALRFEKVWNGLNTFEIMPYVREWISRTTSSHKSWVVFFKAAVQWCFLLPVLAIALLWLNTRIGDAGIARLRGQGMVPEERLIVFGSGAYSPTDKSWSISNVESTRRESGSLWGEFSETWTLKKEGSTLLLSVDYTFDDWHDVKECYMGRNWQLRNEQIISSLFNPQWDISQTGMIDEDGRPSVVFCSHSNYLGQPLQSGPVELVEKVKYRLKPENWGSPFDVMLTPEEKTRYQFQLIHSSSDGIDEAERKELQMIYEDFREQLRKTLQRGAGQ